MDDDTRATRALAAAEMDQALASVDDEVTVTMRHLIQDAQAALCTLIEKGNPADVAVGLIMGTLARNLTAYGPACESSSAPD